ncbi:MAG: winged helix-turn-helix domain-containing protein [Halobacteriales archaeon]
MNEERPISDAPPSAKLVYKVLQYNGSLTQKGIVEKSMLSQRTVRDAIDRLEKLGIVRESVYIPDARQSLYELTVPEESPAASTEAATSSD